MGRKRRKIIRRPVRAPPKVFYCPSCGAHAVTVVHSERYRARVACGNCGLTHEVPWLAGYMPVDAYSTWYDIVTGRVSPDAVKAKIERLEAVASLAESVAEGSLSESEEAPATEAGEEEYPEK